MGPPQTWKDVKRSITRSGTAAAEYGSNLVKINTRSSNGDEGAKLRVAPISVHLVRASSSLRLGSRIVPRTPSSLGKPLAKVTSMQPFDNVRLAYLRSALANARTEKARLAHEIRSPATAFLRKQRARLRSTAIDVDLQVIKGQLEDFIAAAKSSIAAKNSPS